MTTDFKIIALNSDDFTHLFKLTDTELEERGMRRMIVDSNPSYPCRVSLQDAEIGEEVILLPYQHHKSASPYQSSGPIFVRKNVATAFLNINEIPKMLLHRLLSLRGYSKDGMMVQASVIEGQNVAHEIISFLGNTKISYIHIHNAKPGCYNCYVERV